MAGFYNADGHVSGIGLVMCGVEENAGYRETTE
jgi:hypothetical protein